MMVEKGSITTLLEEPSSKVDGSDAATADEHGPYQDEVLTHFSSHAKRYIL